MNINDNHSFFPTVKQQVSAFLPPHRIFQTSNFNASLQITIKTPIKMQFTTLLTLAVSTLSVTAAPAPLPATDAVAGKVQLIDLWQDAGFLGLKFTGSSTVGTCENLKGTGFKNNVTSGKAKPGFRCTVWVKEDCLGTGFSFNIAGSNQFPRWIDNQSSSWKCVEA